MVTQETLNKFKYMNLHLWTDVHPYEVVRWVSDKTVELRLMDATRITNMEFVPGGFAAHCRNNSDQRWTYTSNQSNPVIRARLGKKGWRSANGRHVPSTEPLKFHDYNF